MKSNISKILLIIFLFLIFLFITAKSYASNVFYELNNNIFRLHIIANSDSTEDQDLKLKVRDKIIEYMETLTKNASNKSEVISIVSAHKSDFQTIAEEVITENGFDYSVRVELGNFYFPTKYYGNVSMPAGNYDALKIEIGEAIGQNWWCSLFPPLCFTDVSSGVINEESDKKLKNNLDSEEYSIITSDSKTFKFKFKILEIFN